MEAVPNLHLKGGPEEAPTEALKANNAILQSLSNLSRKDEKVKEDTRPATGRPMSGWRVSSPHTFIASGNGNFVTL